MKPRINFFGTPVVLGVRSEEALQLPRKSMGLLASLAMEPGRSISREELSGRLWPHARDGQARASLRQELATLKKGLTAAGLDYIVATKDRVALNLPDGSTDVGCFSDGIGATNPEQLFQAVRFYKGDFLRDLRIRSKPFEEWVWLERVRLKNLAVNGLRKLLYLSMKSHAYENAQEVAETLISIEVTEEVAYRALMVMARDGGDKSEALRLYYRCETALKREMDTVPSLETRSLADDIRREVTRPSGYRRAQRAWLAVVQFRLDPPKQNNAALRPDYFAQAQDLFLERAKKTVELAHGDLVDGPNDRVVAVFPARSGNQELALAGAVEAASALVSKAVGLTSDIAIWPKAGIAAGPMLFSSRVPITEIAGEALLRAGEVAGSANGGEIAADRAIADLVPHLVTTSLRDGQSDTLLLSKKQIRRSA